MAAIARLRRAPAICTALLLTAAGPAVAVPATRAALRPASVAAVQSDPFYAAWVAALDAVPTRAGAERGTPIDAGPSATRPVAPVSSAECATHDDLETQLAAIHARRVDLLQSLAARGFAPTAAPPGVAPWPWGTVAEPPGDAIAAVLDSSDLCLMHDTGNIAYINRENQLEVDPIFASNAFYAAHDDEYDVLVVMTTFPSQLFLGQFIAYHLTIGNDVTGLGFTHIRDDELFDNSWRYTQNLSPGRLKGFLHFGQIGLLPPQPDQMYTSRYTPIELLGHELSHRWLARIGVEVVGFGPAPVLLGRQFVHWSFIANTDGSAVEGNTWSPLTGRRWISGRRPVGYSSLDLYLMGMVAPAEVDPASLFYLTAIEDIDPPYDRFGNPWTTGTPPTPDVKLDAVAVRYTVDDVALANGYRLPAYPDSPREVRVAFALVWNNASPVTPVDFQKFDALRTAFSAWFHTATRQRGSIDSHLGSLPARFVFEHRPRGDVESATEPIVISTRVGLEQRSRPTRLSDVAATLIWSVNDDRSVETAMTATTPGEFTVELPPQSLGAVIRYSMRAETPLPGHTGRWPEADGVFQFRVTADNQGPTVQHAARNRWSRLAEPPLLRALVRDAHGIADVRVEYRINGGALQSLPMTVQGVSDIWEMRPDFPGRIGDLLEYRIVARDVAAVPHETRSPASGFYSWTWERALLENAEADDPMWTHRTLTFGRPDEWHRETILPVAGQFSWKVGPTNNLVGGSIARPQNSVLEGPSIRIYPGGSLSITHRYAFLRHEQSLHEAWDGGIVEWQDMDRDAPIGRWYVIHPERGYPFGIVSYDTDSPLRGYPVFSGYEPFPIEDVFPFESHHVNRRVRFRFRVTTSVDVFRRSLDGWYIDEIRVDPGPPPTAIALAALDGARTEAGVRLTWRGHDVEPGDVFHVQRAEVGADGGALPFEAIGSVTAVAGTVDYEFDDAMPPAGELAYRVVAVSHGVESAALEVRVAVAPRFALHPNVPNPFNPTTRIRFELADAGRARLVVYDVGGRVVRTLVDAPYTAGGHVATWDGTDGGGHAAASGVYLIRLESAGRSAVRRVALVR